MPDFELRAKGKDDGAGAVVNRLADETLRLEDVQKKASAVAAEYSKSVALTSKEASALGKAMNLTAGEAKKLVAAEKLTADEAKKLAQAQQQADQKTRGLKDSASSAASSLHGLAVGMQAAFSAAIVQQIISASAQLIALADAAGDAREGLDLMTGGQADARIDAITTALRGTVSEAQAAAAAQHLFATGLDLSAQQTAEVVRVASRLGEVYGSLDIDSAITKFEGLTETMSSRAGRQFGLDMELAKQRAAELMATTPGLTQEMANLSAILEQASVKADMVDQTLDGADLAMQQSAAAAEDMKVALGELITEGLDGAIVGARNLVVGLRDVHRATQDAAQNALVGAGSFEEYAAQLHGAGLMTQSTFDEIESGIPALFANRAQINRMREAWEAYQATQQDATAAMRDATDAARRQAAATGYAIPPVQELAASEEELADAQREAEQAARAYAQAQQEALRTQQSMLDIAQGVAEGIAAQGRSFQGSQESGQLFVQALRASGNEMLLLGENGMQAQLALGLVTEQQIATQGSVDALMGSLSAGNMSMERAVELWDLLAAGQSNAVAIAVESSEVQAAVNAGYSGWEVAAVTASDNVVGAQAPVEESTARLQEAVQAITANAPLAMAAIADNAPAAQAALDPMARKLAQMQQFFVVAPEIAPPALAAISEAFVQNWDVWGTSAGMIHGMKADLAWMLAHNNISVNIDVNGGGGIPSGVGSAGMAGGGSFLATGPVHLTVGEKDPELVHVTPLGSPGLSTFAGPNILQMAGGGNVLAGLGAAPGTVVNINTLSLPNVLNARDFVPELRRELRAQGMDFAEVA